MKGNYDSGHGRWAASAESRKEQTDQTEHSSLPLLQPSPSREKGCEKVGHKQRPVAAAELSRRRARLLPPLWGELGFGWLPELTPAAAQAQPQPREACRITPKLLLAPSPPLCLRDSFESVGNARPCYPTCQPS